MSEQGNEGHAAMSSTPNLDANGLVERLLLLANNERTDFGQEIVLRAAANMLVKVAAEASFSEIRLKRSAARARELEAVATIMESALDHLADDICYCSPPGLDSMTVEEACATCVAKGALEQARRALSNGGGGWE